MRPAAGIPVLRRPEGRGQRQRDQKSRDVVRAHRNHNLRPLRLVATIGIIVAVHGVEGVEILQQV